jgi:hypothetical protein
MLLSVANSRARNLETIKSPGLFPEAIQENASLFISFIERYYDYMNSVGLPSGELANITSDKDIDRVSNKYLTQIQSLIARNVPESTVLDKVTLYKIILQYYRTRGSEDSIYAFFKLFFNELITVFYPRDYIFELSQGSGSWQDIDFNKLRVSRTNPNKSRLLITSDIIIAPLQIGSDSKSVELIYFGENIWTYTGNAINTQFPYIEKVQISADESRWKYAYQSLEVYSDDDTEWPDDATWSAFQRDVYYESVNNSVASLLENGQTGEYENGVQVLLESSSELSKKRLEYDSGSIWQQLGNIITGEEINSYLGNSVSLSADGTRMAIGSTYFGTQNDDSGHSRVYALNRNDLTWSQLGQDLTDTTNNSNISYSLLLSADGNRVVVSGSDSMSNEVGSDYGTTRVYQYAAGTNRWKQIGQAIVPFNITAVQDFITEKLDNIIAQETNSAASLYEAKFTTEGGSATGISPINFYGTRIAFSEDGTTLAITYLFSYSSTVIYKYNATKREWETYGQTIAGTQQGDQSGYSMSLNYNGTILAVGSPRYDNTSDIDSGKVTVYRYDTNSKSWQVYGNTLIPDGDDYDSCGFSVSLNSAGTTLAVGTIKGKNEEGISTGYTQIFNYTLSSNSWVQLGKTIYGENQDDYGGFSVALNSSGNICAVGYKYADVYNYTSGYVFDSHVIDSGVIKVYEFISDDWAQIANNISSEYAYDYVGSTLSISADGLTVATGSVGWFNDVDGSVRVYNLDIIREFKFYNSIQVQAIPEFALSYGEIINSLEDYPGNMLYETTNLNPIIWTRTNINRQWLPFDRKSFVSDSYKLHDGYYWQKYSYDIKTSKPISDWLDDYLKFVHPAGLQLFASVLLQLTSTRKWSEFVDYSASQPQQDFTWILAQRAPTAGTHTPFYQPGWLSRNARSINVFAAALRLNGQDINLYNLVYHILHHYSENINFRNKVVREDYQRWIKFLDATQVSSSGYSNKTIAQASEEYAFNNVCKFNNVAIIIDILSDGRYLENGYPRDLESGVMRLTESTEYETP